MNEENERKLREREEQYKQHFQRYGQNLDQRQSLHDQTVGEQEREKLRKMQDWEQNGSKLY